MPHFGSTTLMLLAVSSLLAFGALQAADVDELKPGRVLLVIDNQWQDQESFVLDVQQTEIPNYDLSYRPAGTDFFQLVVLLKSWGVPFDILRLDQERITTERLLDGHGKALYGCMLFALDGESYYWDEASGQCLHDAVAKYGISLVALNKSVYAEKIGWLCGLSYEGYNMTADRIEVKREHFLTHGLGPVLVPVPESGYVHRTRVKTLNEDVQVLATHGSYPALTELRANESTVAIWIGGDRYLNLEHQAMRTLLRRALTEAVGYSVFKTWENRKIIVMDDPGGAQCAWLDSWHYPTLTREQIEERLIAPLKAHKAKLVINVVPGFVNDEKRTVELSFQQDFTDKFGARQNFVSTGEGLREGLAAGVFELQSHGWTHMQPDLEREPGPWWGAPLDGEKAEVGWYREFGDTRRADPMSGVQPIPAAVQAEHLQKGRQWLTGLFGIDPLSFVSGGLGITLTPEAHTWKLAAREGFGWFCWHGGYLGPDLAVRGWLFEGTPDAPATIEAQPDAHDKGIAEHPEKFLNTFKDAGPEAVYTGFNEYVGYMHAARQSRALPRGLAWNCDSHYCQYFKDNPAVWSLDIADWQRKSLAGKAILADGKEAGSVAQDGVQQVRIPAGLGEHRLEIK
ncbi:hypothetical protein LLH00_13895 [bacterium]|nr:hypothetical protein [bacterium]